jgi:hypothetical protein
MQMKLNVLDVAADGWCWIPIVVCHCGVIVVVSQMPAALQQLATTLEVGHNAESEYNDKVI